MTREEAIAKLKEKRQIFIDEWADLDDIVEAFDMAITALSSEPSVSIQPKTIANNCDLISRADAMGAVQDHFNANGFKGYDDGQKMMDRIKALPSADAVSREEHFDAVANRITDMEERGFVSVVRCKDCRHWNSETKGCKRNPSVEAWYEDDFCKYGKRWSNAID